ncbi:MAG: hypothetical protein LBE71_05565 [Dysgonamonadaceae bacterium]|nr:hypothetical protein [Dysgonamonadaceae bacterium]
MKKNKQIKIVACIVGLWISVFTASAQPPVIKVAIDSVHILIGQQTQIRLEVAANKNQPLQIPVVADTLVNGVEVLDISKIDTTDLGNDRIQLKYRYLITSFDSALYLLPPFKVIAGRDTVYSEALALNVSTYQVDTTQQFYDIKDIIQPEFVWTDYLPLLVGIILGLLLIAAVIFIIYRLANRKPVLFFNKEEPYVPPHIHAIQGLDKVKSQKLWQAGKVKEYHSDVTDIVRTYISERFDIPAPEMTSGEILDKIKESGDADTSYGSLKQMLILADFVKFAKYNPLSDENELSLTNAYLFVEQTKKEESAEEEELTIKN